MKLAIALSTGWLLASTALVVAAETGPVIVIPGRPGVPVIVDGRDISYSVVEGDWGLGRPSQTEPVVIYRFGRPTQFGPSGAHYFPSVGQAPRVGRKEIDVPTPPQTPQSYIRSWGTQSDPTPATSPTPLAMPPMIVAPQGSRRQSGQ